MLISLKETAADLERSALWSISYYGTGYVLVNAQYPELYLMPQFGNGGYHSAMYCEDDITEPSALWEFTPATVAPQIKSDTQIATMRQRTNICMRALSAL